MTEVDEGDDDTAHPFPLLFFFIFFLFYNLEKSSLYKKCINEKGVGESL